MPLSSVAVDRSRLHVRAVTYEGYRRDDDLFDIEGHLTDVKDHDYTLLTGVRRAADRPGVIEHDRAGTGGALVESEHERHRRRLRKNGQIR